MFLFFLFVTFFLGNGFMCWSTRLGKVKQLSLKRNMVNATLHQIENHSVFKAGFGIACCSAPIKPDLILGTTDKAIASMIDSAFSFDAHIEPKPAGTMKPFKECKALHNGLCCSDPCRARAGMGSKNIYSWIGNCKLKVPVGFEWLAMYFLSIYVSMRNIIFIYI